MRQIGGRALPPVGLRGPSEDEIEASRESARLAPRVVPKGVYRYRNDDEADAAMERWRVEGMVKRAREMAAARTDAPEALLRRTVRLLLERESDLRARGVVSLDLFGSVARKEARPDSDVDIVVEISPSTPMSLTGFSVLQADLAGILRRRVDLAEWRILPPQIAESARRDAIRIIPRPREI